MKKFLIVFADCWDDMWRRRQQLAWRLAQSRQIEHVIYIERPVTAISFIKFLIGRSDKDGKERWQRLLRNRSCIAPVTDKLSVVTTFAPFPLLNSKFLFGVSERLKDRWILCFLKKHFDYGQPIVWVSHPQISVKTILALKPHLLWYDCTEDFSVLPRLPNCVRIQIEDTDRWLTENANVITAVSQTLYKEKLQFNPNTYWLPNAVDTDIFLKPKEQFRLPMELLNVPRPVLSFVGGLNDWAHDWDLLDYVARSRPDWTILLIGELCVGQKIRQILRNHSNIICVGQKPYGDLPPYLIYSDACFLFYRQTRANNTRNSQKLFLYFAAGKPVISTQSADIESYSGLISIAQDAESFIDKVESALLFKSKIQKQKRLEIAKANSWSIRAERICDILQNHIKNDCSAKVRSYYNNIYYKKARFSVGAVHSYYRRFLEYLCPVNGKRLLDVSCGTGELLKCAEEAGLHTSGLDISNAALNTAKSALGNPILVCGEAEKLPYKRATFDYITCLGSLEHYIEPKVAIEEMMRVSTKDAKWVLLVPNLIFERLHENYLRISKLAPLQKRGNSSQIISSARTIKEWKKLFESMGLKIIITFKDNACFYSPPQNWSAGLIKFFCRYFVRLLPMSLSYQVGFVLVKQ